MEERCGKPGREAGVGFYDAVEKEVRKEGAKQRVSQCSDRKGGLAPVRPFHSRAFYVLLV